MKVYLVGGAIRDRLLDRLVQERDWVVVHSSPEEMMVQGFIPVGKAFPVFLHPQTKEEYALARTERKVGPGYHGFSFHTAKDVSLKDDLARRDLTINALAEDETGNLIDYYGGLDDLKQRILRHITPAFSEDPVRVLRVARFAARYAYLGFQVAPETLTLMHHMGAQKELSYLVPERVWAEWESALGEQNPSVFFKVLQEAGVLNELFPLLSECPHLERALDELDRIAADKPDLTVRFAVFMHYLLRAETFNADLENLVNTYKIPNAYQDLALGLQQALPYYQRLDFKVAESILDFYQAIDAHRRFDRAMKLLGTCALIDSAKKLAPLKRIFEDLHTFKINIPEDLKGSAIADYIQQQRLLKLQSYQISGFP